MKRSTLAAPFSGVQFVCGWFLEAGLGGKKWLRLW
jgi:hypothetical protein